MTDPRFDPVFQRGYSGPAPELVVRETVVDPPVRPVAAPDAYPAPAPAPVADDIGTEEPGAWAPPRRNPFAIALLVVGVTMVAAGVWLTQAFAATSANGYTPDEQTIAILQQALGPALLLGGIVGVVAWLVLGALAAAPGRARS
jgi:hypothetical protein